MLKAIGAAKLTEYFEYLDGLRESGVTNMFGAPAYLMKVYPGMSKQEALKVFGVWADTFSDTLPPEDRVEKALEE